MPKSKYRTVRDGREFGKLTQWVTLIKTVNLGQTFMFVDLCEKELILIQTYQFSDLAVDHKYIQRRAFFYLSHAVCAMTAYHRNFF